MQLLDAGLWGLFAGCFLSATLIPFPSDVFLITAYQADYPIAISLTIATIANFLGGLTNYYIGYKCSSEKLIRKFKLNEEKIDRWRSRLDKWGIYLGLIAWVPIIGEPMTACLGFFRVRLPMLAFMMFIGRFLHYLILTLIFLGWNAA